MDAHLIALSLQAGSAVRLERMSIEQCSELTDDIERKLDEADAAAEQTAVRYSASEVFGRARSRIDERAEI
ncbi:MAG: hypothetical protein SPH33_07645 [Atopobiaceae bacterium]|nr:hypothetical protein [Atopobiaceae bacterium]